MHGQNNWSCSKSKDLFLVLQLFKRKVCIPKNYQIKCRRSGSSCCLINEPDQHFFFFSLFFFSCPRVNGKGIVLPIFFRGGSLGNITTKIHIKHGSHREKGRNCVFFMYKILCSEYARMQDFVSNFQQLGACSNSNLTYSIKMKWKP